MRLVFQLPASITSVVDAPRLVSSDANPTRPDPTRPDPTRVSRYSTFDTGGHGRRREPQSNHLRRQRHHPVTRFWTRRGP